MIRLEGHLFMDTNSSTGTKIFCANCVHCKLVQMPTGNGKYYLRVRCAAGKWKKKLGEEKLHKYFTVAQRSIPYCDAYEDMGDDEFIKDLPFSLPAMDELYEKSRGASTRNSE